MFLSACLAHSCQLFLYHLLQTECLSLCIRTSCGFVVLIEEYDGNGSDQMYSGGYVRWTMCDIFIHINSFTKNNQNSDVLIQETSFTKMSHHVHHFSCMKLHSQKCHIWSITFSYVKFQSRKVHIWSITFLSFPYLLIYMYENVTYGPSQV